MRQRRIIRKNIYRAYAEGFERGASIVECVAVQLLTTVLLRERINGFEVREHVQKFRDHMAGLIVPGVKPKKKPPYGR